MAAGIANLNYLLENDLQGNARRVGGLLLERLRGISAGLGIVREVRGRGLMAGVELVEPHTDTPSPRAASLVLESARERGLLIGKGGGHSTSSVLRIAPPLSLTVAEAEEGAAILEHALRTADTELGGESTQ
jgi:4-aminobutyrate aminotransferase